MNGKTNCNVSSGSDGVYIEAIYYHAQRYYETTYLFRDYITYLYLYGDGTYEGINRYGSGYTNMAQCTITSPSSTIIKGTKIQLNDTRYGIITVDFGYSWSDNITSGTWKIVES